MKIFSQRKFLIYSSQQELILILYSSVLEKAAIPGSKEENTPLSQKLRNNNICLTQYERAVEQREIKP